MLENQFYPKRLLPDLVSRLDQQSGYFRTLTFHIITAIDLHEGGINGLMYPPKHGKMINHYLILLK